MRKLQISSFIVISMFVCALSALQAGESISYITVVEEHVAAANGTLWGARVQPNNIEYIGCTTVVYAGEPPTGICTARNSNGLLQMGQTSNPAVVQTIQSIGPASRVSFFAYINTDELFWLSVDNNSKYLAPAP